jgi:two-component sensor histidine kinase
VLSDVRHSLDELADHLPPDKLEDLHLVVSELATNSVPTR